MKMARSSILLMFFISLSAIGLKADEDISFANMASMFLQNMGETGDGDNLPSLGSIMGSFLQNSESPGDNAGKLLSGLGNMLGGQGGKLDPSIIGSVMSMLSQGASDPNKPKRRSNDNPADNLGDILNVASAFLGGNNVGNSAAGILPVLMNTLNSLSASEVQKRSDDHKDHSQFLPPFLEKIHLYWDIFISSELGRTIWEKSGLKKATKAFTGPDGKISVEMMLKNFENHSFRRHWIKAAAGYLTDVVIHVAKPEVYQRYLKSAEYIVNTFLDAQGLPRSVHFNLKKPEKSITSIVNYVLRKYLDTDTDVSGYVSSALAYLKQLLKMAETTTKSFASRGDYQALTDRVTDTLNLEVIEPVLRVFRAYKHSVQAPQCSEHLMCLVNRDSAKGKSGLPGFKAGLTKISSLVASAALSYQNGGGFWDLYNAMQSDINCEAKYPADCNAFHEHEMKVTTEVYHNEL